MKAKVRHRSHSVEFKRQVALDYLAGETLHSLARRHDSPEDAPALLRGLWLRWRARLPTLPSLLGSRLPLLLLTVVSQHLVGRFGAVPGGILRLKLFQLCRPST